MNKTYRTVWNATTGTWVAAAETARGHSKSNSTMKSAVATAVAMMAGVGGVAVSFDADAQAANGAGGLALCGPTGGANGQAFGSGSSMGTALTAACGASSSRLSLNHPMAFQLYNNTASNGSGVGPASAATEVGIGGSKDGHLMLLGGSGVHIQGPADFDNNVNLTNHRINNLAAGTADTDAVNVAQLKAAITASDDPYVSIATGLYATAKPAVTTAGNSGIAIGANASSTGVSAIALGGNTVASAANAMAIGTIANATAAETTAVGVGANATANNATALGRGASATAANSAALGSYSVANRANSVSVGNATTQRQIVNVAAGTQITDAVNLGQMNTELDKKVDKTTTKVGGTVASTASGNASNIAIGSGAASTSGTANSASIALGANASATGAGAIAVGSGSTTSGSGGAAFGVRSNAGGANAVALGTDANATGTNSVALGYGSTADRANAVSVGSSTLRRQITNMAAGTQATDAVNLSQLTPVVTALGGGATINATTGAVTGPTYNLTNGGRQTTVGDALSALDGSITTVNNNLATKVDNRFVKVLGSTDATAAGLNSVAIGNGAITGSGDPSVTNQVAIGSSANAQGLSAVAIGSSAATDGTGAQAVGRFATATGNFATAMGNQSSAQAAGATALGDRASVATGATNSVAIGSQANIGTNVTNSVALGAGSTATRNNTVSVGSSTVKRQITDVAAGTLATDAVNLAQLNAAIASVGPVTSSPYFKANGAGDGSDDAKAVGVGSVAVGSNASTTTDGGVAIGDNAASTMANGVAIGKTAVASLDGVAIGRGADATTTNAIALGAQSSAADNATSLGFNAKSASNAMALGANTVAVGNNSVALGNGSVASAANTVSVGSAGNERKIVNVAAGDLSATSTDAVNGSQLFATNQDIGDLRDSLKDGGVIDPNTGKSLAVVYDDASKKAVTLGGAGAPAVQLKNVADATENNDAVNLGQLKDAGLVAPVDPSNPGAGLESLAVTYGTNADGSANFDSVALKGGTNGTTLSNVAAGKADKDAVNVSQLKDSGLIGGDGKAIAAVTYDRNADGTPNLGSVTLGGAGASTPVALKNVADATENNDAVNLGQLKDAGLVAPVDPSNPGAGLASLAVTYGTKADGSANFDSVALKGGANGTTLSNVAAGVADKDAVNVSQLKGSGLIGDDGKALAAVTYDVNADGTPNYNSVQLGSGKSTGPVALSNVADGKADDDAVNVGQLKTSGLIGEDDKGNLTSLAVAYDDASKGKVTLGGGATGTTITNVKAGDLSATSTDAVNGSQLFATNQDIGDLRDSLKDGGVIDPTTGESLAVVYDGTAKDKVTLAGTTGTTLSNVKAGVADMDAVNVSQLKDSGLIGGDGKAIAAVTYDRNADGTPNYGSVTLGDGNGPVKVSNVADATGDSDALNLGQLKQAGLVGDDGKGNLTSLAVAYDDASKGKVTLGGGATGTTITNVKAGDLSATSTDAVNGSQLFATNQDIGDLRDSLKDGGVIDPTTGESLAVVYDGTAKDKVTLAGTTGTTITNVKAGVADLDAVNVSQLKDSGLIGGDGKAIAAVTYDRNADGTPNFGSVTLGGAGASTPVALKNVAAGVDGTDAVNVDQMTDGLTKLKDEIGSGAADLRFVKVNADQTTGTPALATGAQAVAIGAAANSSGAHALALGTGSRATGLDSVAIGYNSVANEGNTVSVGSVSNQRRIVNVANGNVAADSTDAVNGGQLYAAMNNLSTSMDAKTQQALNDFTTTLDEKTQAAVDNVKSRSIGVMDVSAPLVAVEGLQGNNLASLNGADPNTATAIAVGSSSAASGANAVAVGLQNVAGSDNSVAIGSFAGTGAGQAYSVAVGSDAQTNGTQAVALGAHVQAGGDRAVAVGNNNTWALGDSSVAFGDGAKARAGTTNSIAVGTNANVAANVTNAMALGANANVATGATGGIALGAGSLANRGNALSIGSAGAERQIINVAAGTQATDAVNVSQLTGVTTALGGKAAVGADGSITQPTYTVGGTDYHNVGDALDALAQTGDANAVVYDGTAKDKVTLAGTTGTTLSNVKAGVADMDAVNVSQLKDSGLIGGDGKAIAAVTYDRNADGTPNYGSVTLGDGNGPVKVSNVADATGDSDALNLGQLKQAGLVGDDGKGNLTSLAVAYDDASKGKVTLGGGATGTTITNVKAGDLSATSTDAVNGSQLFATNQDIGDLRDSLKDGGVIDPTTGESLAVVYDGTAKDKVTLAGATGTTLSNVKAGVADMDAVNVSQLKGSGLVGDDGKAIAAVTYDRNTDGTPNYGSVTLGSAGASTPVALKNVAAAVDGTDAVNYGQLQKYVADNAGGPGNPLAVAYDDAAKGAITLGGANGTTITNVAAGAVSATSTDAINGSQLHGVSQSVADSLGGGSTVGTDGSVTAPTYSLADPADASKKTDYHSVGDALDNLDGRVVDNTKNITVINNQLADSGLVDPSTGQAIAAVTYDRNTDGTPNYNSVKLGGDKATGPVALSNVADGVARHDAVNLGQLQDAGLVAPVDPSNPGAGLASLAVTYGTNADGSANFDEVALKGGTNGTTIKNVAAGDVSATSKDAINGSQLFATNERVGSLEDSLQSGGVIDPVTRESLAVVYDSAAKDHVTLGGKGATAPVTLSNVAAGTADTDAVNVAQLKDAGLVAPVDPTNPGSGLASLAVTYGKNADGSANFDSVSLKGTAGTTITNVAAGAVSATSTDAINGAQLHGVSQSVADSLGGGSTVGADGTVTNPTYSLADPADASKKQDYHNVGDALDNLDGRVVDNTKNITVINNQLADSGLVDPLTGQSIAAVTYDRNADGTSNYNSVKLGGDKATGPVALKNVADGVDRTDAVNVGQLQDAGLVAPVDPTKPGTLASLAVTYGKNTDGTANFDQVVLAGKSGTTITNVKAGAVNATSTDAVNGAQLHGVSQSVADSLGGGSTVDANGNVTNPTYTVNNQTFNNVGDAITNISNSLADGSIGLVQQDETTRDITVAKDTDGTVVDFTGTAGDRKLTGVAAGTVSATSNDAINGSQLHGTAQSVADVIGGGTTVDVDGKLADTAIQVNGQKYSTVAEAVQAAAAYGATDSLAVRYDLNADGTPNYGSVTLGGTGAAPVILTNVADGVNRNDAVNFGQLSDLSDKFDGLGDRVGALEQNPGNGGGSGGGSGDNPYFSGTDVTPGSSTAANAGTGTGNTAAGSGASVGGGANNATVIGSNASATKDNGAAIGSGAKSTGEGATAIGSNASASGSQSVAIGSGSVANEANTVSFGNADNPDTNRRIVNIADGVNANDAASKGQLDRAVGGLQGQINDVSKNAYSGIAAATALTMIPGVDPGKTLSFGVGGATYKGYQAVAFGGEARITQNLKMKAGVGLSSGGNTVGVGASYQW